MHNPQKIFFILLLMIVSSLSTIASASDKHDHGAHKSAVGTHGMALFKVNSVYYASHMALANSIHAHQVIFSFSLAPKDKTILDELFQKNTLVSVMPETFDLMALMSGKLTRFKGGVFSGHFERGGELTANNVEFIVNERLLIDDLSDEGNGQYHYIPLQNSEALLVHRITTSKSFDQILLVNEVKSGKTEPGVNKTLFVGNAEPISATKFPLMVNFTGGTLKVLSQLYLELDDFR